MMKKFKAEARCSYVATGGTSSSRGTHRRSLCLSPLLSVLLLSTLLLACAGQQPSPSNTDAVEMSSTPLHEAGITGNIIKLKELLDSGKHDVNALDGAGRTPLAAAMATCSKSGSATFGLSWKVT